MSIDRRSFLASTAAFAAAPFVLTGCASRTARKFAANEIVNVAVIGCGRISTTFEMPCLLKIADRARIVALCDLDRRRVLHSKARLEREYAQKGIKMTVDVYKDYKEVIQRKDVDAVAVCLPDFWHALVASYAICAGKAIWLQKPFTQTIREGRILANLAKRFNTVVQVGSQQRSWSQFDAVCEAVAAGHLGTVKRVEVGLGIDKSGGIAAAEPVPETFDYATWLGPTDPTAPYNWTRCHTQDLKRISDRPGWIQLAPYGWGMITNWGAHHLDIVQWGLGRQNCGPEGVSGTCEWMDLTGGKLWNVHTGYDLHYSYNGGKTDVHVCDKYQNGVKFIGENGDWLFCTRGAAKVTPSDPDVPMKPGHLPALAASRNAILPAMKPELVGKGSAMQLHVDNWIDAVRAGDPSMTRTSAEHGHRSTSVCSLGQMCMELGRGKKGGASLKWCAKNETTGCDKADALMKPFARDKFDLRVNLAEFGLDFDDVLKG